MDGLRRGLAVLLVLTLVCPPSAVVRPGYAQEQGGQDQAQNQPAYSAAQLEQLVAPIALYPDSLVAQILMASTYPIEIVEAARWSKQNPKVSGSALEDAMQKQSWDASVKSLTAFPQVLAMMDEKLDWTTDLGNAFLAQQADVMNAVQALRARAQKEGNLKSNEQQTVVVEQQPSGSQPQTIIIQPANPQVVYVPAYSPTVYGAWPYPAYPPYPYYPPGYVLGASLISFGVGMAVGSALWGGCNWGSSNVNVNVNNYNNFNRTNIQNNNWSHNVDHRRGAGYDNQNVANRYGRGTQNAQSREQFRGRAEQGRQQIARGDADRFKGQQAQRGAGDASRFASQGQGQRQGGGGQRFDDGRGRAGGADRGASRQAAAQRNPGAFNGVGNGGDVRKQADRGRASRQSAASYGGGNRGGGNRAGGGVHGGGGAGGRGGGGGRAGGGGGRGGRR